MFTLFLWSATILFWWYNSENAYDCLRDAFFCYANRGHTRSACQVLMLLVSGVSNTPKKQIFLANMKVSEYMMYKVFFSQWWWVRLREIKSLLKIYKILTVLLMFTHRQLGKVFLQTESRPVVGTTCMHITHLHKIVWKYLLHQILFDGCVTNLHHKPSKT